MSPLNSPFGQKSLEFDRYISPDGEVYKFNNDIDQFVLAGVTGTGLPSIEYRTQRGPFQHGSTPLGLVLQPRVIQLLHRRNACDRQAYWAARSDLLNILRPNRQAVNTFAPGVLRKILPDRTKRDICVFLQTGPQFSGMQQGRWDEFSIQEALQFIAHDPTLFDPDENQVELALDTSASAIVFAEEFPITFISNATTGNNSITYTGTWETFPTILLIGPMRNPIIRNVTTGEKIEMEHTIGAGRTVTISLQYGNKTVVNDLGTNLIGTVTSDSDLATFHLAPAPEAPAGVNSIGAAASSLTSASRIVFQYFTRYIGI